MELKIIYLDRMQRLGVEVETGGVRMFNTELLGDPNNYIQTKLGVNNELVLNTDKRKSSTFNRFLRLGDLPEFTEYFNNNEILQGIEYSRCELIKYEQNDFFQIHKDTIMYDFLKKGEHKYTCLIFGTFEQKNGYFEGGELVFKDPEGSYNITLNLSNEVKNNKYVAVIFSTNMYHEVLPVTSGTRYVLKKPLFVKAKEPIEQKSPDKLVDELEGDGGFQARIADY